MSIVDVSVKKPVTMTMLLMIVMMFGLYACFQLPVDFLPDIERPILTVSTTYTGAGPEEVETSVTRTLENVLTTVENIDKVTSDSKEGSSQIQLEFKWGTDMDNAMFQTREKVDLVRDDLPDDADNPVIYKFSTDLIPVMGYYLVGIDDPATAYDIADNTIRKSLEQLPGVGSITVDGGSKTELQIDLIQNRMQAYGLNSAKIAQIVKANDLSVSGGYVYQGSVKYGVRTDAEIKTLQDARNIVVDYRNGAPILLGDIANISYGGSEDTVQFFANGREAVAFQVTKSSGANTVEVANAVKKRLDSLKPTLPPTVELVEQFSTAQSVEDSQASVSSAALTGAIFAMLVLFFYLWDWRSLLVIGLSIPTSIIATFIIMYFMDISLNIISMSGLALGVGMMVDSSIVVLENIFRHRAEGMGKYSASINGAKEVMLAITASTFTTIAVFIPIFIVPGFVAQLFKDLAITVLVSLLCSLVISVTLVPMLCSLLIKDVSMEAFDADESEDESALDTKKMRFNDRILHKIDIFYRQVLEWTVHNKKKVVFGSSGAVIVLLIASVMLVGKEYMPTNDDGQFTINLVYPAGTRVEYNRNLTLEIVKRLPEVIGEENIKVIGTRVKTGSFFGGTVEEFKSRIEVKLWPVSQRREDITTIVNRVRPVLAEYPVENRIRIGGPTGGSGSAGGADAIDLDIQGDDSAATLQIANQIVEMMKAMPGIENPYVDEDPGNPEVVLRPDRVSLSREGLSPTDLFSSVRTSFGGTVATTVLGPTGNDIDVRVRVRDEDRISVDSLLNQTIPTTTGTASFRTLVGSRQGIGPSRLRRYQSTRYIKVKASTSGAFQQDLTGAVAAIQKEIDEKIFLPAGTSVVFRGDFEDIQESMIALFGAFFVAIFIVYALMAAQFESYIAPFVIMASVPFGAFGAIVFLFLTGRSLNVISAAGIVVLVGIVINNGIVLIDYMNQLLASGMTPEQAAVTAGVRRIRPVFMTTLTTVLGMIPMALGLGEGGSTYAPLATSILGGLTISTVFTLIIVPTAYAGIRKRYPFKVREDIVVDKIVYNK
ncbi:MAG: efflux RND transporter permease subunit [Brevinema sp.]